MKIRNEWMSDELYFGEDYPNNILLKDAVDRFELQRDFSLEGREAEVDGVKEDIVVQSHTSISNQNRYDKKIHCGMNCDIHMGSIVLFDNRTWMVVSKVFDTLAYKTTSVMECNNKIGDIPIIVESQVRLYSMGLWDEKYFPVPESNIVMMIPNNENANSVRRNNVYELYEGDNYKVTDLNRVIMPGIIIAKLEWTDEKVSDFPSPPPSSPINGPLEIKVGQTATYTVESGKHTFSIIGEPTSAYKLTILSDNSCTIKCNKYPYTIVLRATDTTGEYIDKIIKLKSLL